MSDDPLPYGLYYRDALRGIMRRAMSVVAEQGLPDDHYFHITFRTNHPGVAMPRALQAQYPTEMAIILQHVFHDLEVDDAGFSVTLSFNRVQRRLMVPFDAVTMFQDPPANVVLTFLDAEQMLAAQAPADTDDSDRDGAETDADVPAESADHATDERGNVIAIDTFRKP